ncbi:YdhR family protein [Streptomyces sp. NPDC054808]
MQVLSMRFRSPKPVPEIEAMTEASLPLFQALPGLLQKYYVANRENDEVGGIYIWDSPEHLQDYLAGPIVAAMPERFAMPEPPRIEILDVNDHIIADHAAAAPAWAGSIRFKSAIDPAELRQRSTASVPHFAALPGIVEGYRVTSPQTGRVGGIYLWESEKHLDANLASPEINGIPQNYQAIGPVEIEPLRISRILRG